MNPAGPVRAVEVLVIGGGPAGLGAATALAPVVTGDVLVLEREAEAGGIPRHSDHPGYGIRDLKTLLRGPAYARRLSERARRAGAEVRTNAMVTQWAGARSVEVTAPDGRYRVDAQAVVLATGARERPRSARLIPGDRPAGVFTTGQLQNLVHLHHRSPGRRAVVVGAELVSWSAVLTLRGAGSATALMTTVHPSPESYGALTIAGRLALGVPVATRTRVVRIIGRRQVQAVEVEDLDSGRRREVACDTVVFTGDWIPDHELARSAGVELDPGTLGPLVDTAWRTSCSGVFAVGNLVHPVDTADVASLAGRHVAGAVTQYLRGDRPDPRTIRLMADPPLRWLAPGLVRAGDLAPARRRLLAWTDEQVRIPRVTVRRNGRLLVARRLPWPASPGRVFRIPWSLLDGIDRDGNDRDGNDRDGNDREDRHKGELSIGLG